MKNINYILIAAGTAFLCNAQDAQSPMNKFLQDALARDERAQSLFGKIKPEEFNFYLGHNSIDSVFNGRGTCGGAQFFAQATQQKIAEKLSDAMVKNVKLKTLRADLESINAQAFSLCYTCAILEIGRRADCPFSKVPAERPALYLFSPRTTVRGETFYKNGCGEFYKKIPSEKLAQILNAISQE